MHSGMLFLFPHIFRVCLAAKRCGSLDFVSVDDMWWRGGEMASSSMAAPFESHCNTCLSTQFPHDSMGAG